MRDLDELRQKLDGVDRELIRLFTERMDTARDIATVKRALLKPIFDADRENEVVLSRTAQIPESYREEGERFVRLLIEESKRVQRKALNLYLIGMPDCGKTRTAKKLRGIIPLPLVDTDKLIMQRTGRSIDELFDSVGEEGFRIIEREVLRTAAAHGGLLVALGGGTPLYLDNAEIMKYSGLTVFLDRKLENLHDQNIVNRPLLRGASREEINKNIDRQYHERHDRYAACADLTVDPDSDDAAGKIAEFYYNNM